MENPIFQNKTFQATTVLRETRIPPKYLKGSNHNDDTPNLTSQTTPNLELTDPFHYSKLHQGSWKK